MGKLSFQNIKETTKGYGQKWNTIRIVDQRLPLMYIHNSLRIIEHIIVKMKNVGWLFNF